MFFALEVGNATSSGQSLLSEWLSPTGIGTIALALALLVAAYELYLNRRDRRLEREQRERDRPHFALSQVSFEPVELYLMKDNKLGKMHMGLVKVKIANKGNINAQNATAFVSYGDPTDEILQPANWVSVIEPEFPRQIEIPPYVGESLASLAEFLRVVHFDDPKFGNALKKDIPPDGVAAALVFFTLEGSKSAYTVGGNVKFYTLPLEMQLGLNIVMDNSPSSYVYIPKKLILESWNMSKL
ncbi:MAG: hypothetical protein ABSF83_00760 [Nitrososphaerales archaeon]|jgi:hypothetical protein